MKFSPVLMSAQEIAVEPQRVLIDRSKFTFVDHVTRPEPDPAPVAPRPVSISGTLNSNEIYRDPASGREYYLPTYVIELKPGDSPLQVRLEMTPDAAHVGRLWLRLEGTFGVPGVAADPQRVPLRSSVRLSLQYLAIESGGAPDAMLTWKTVSFDQVVHPRHRNIEAVAEIATLEKFDALHRALRDTASQCRLVVRSEADLVVKRYIRPWLNSHAELFQDKLPNWLDKLKPAQLEIGPQPTLVEARPQPTLVEVRPQPTLQEVTRAGASRRPVFEMTADTIQSTVELDWHATPVSVQDANRLSIEGIQLRDDIQHIVATTHDVQIRAVFEQYIAFNIDPMLHAYVYPNRAPSQEAGLIRYSVSPGYYILQDGAERNVFYFVPDEFRLARDDIRSPTYKPSVHVAFWLAPNHDPNSDQAQDYGVTFTFRAVPYLAEHRESDARRFIAEHALAPANRPIAFLPLSPDWSLLSLSLPDEAGGIRSVDRPDATLVFDRHLLDSLELTSKAFSEVFSSMRGAGETLNGVVKYRLTGSSAVHSVPFSGRLDKLTGPAVDVMLSSPSAADDGRFRVELTNAIESPIDIQQLTLSLREDAPDAGFQEASIHSHDLPLRLLAGETLVLWLAGVAFERASAVRLDQLQFQVMLDFNALWTTVLDEPGWDLVHNIAVTADPSWFAGASAVERLDVTFNRSEALVQLTADRPSQEVRLIRPLIPFLLKDEVKADAFDYRVASYRNAGGSGELTKIAESAVLTGSGPSLDLTPPLP